MKLNFNYLLFILLIITISSSLPAKDLLKCKGAVKYSDYKLHIKIDDALLVTIFIVKDKKKVGSCTYNTPWAIYSPNGHIPSIQMEVEKIKCSIEPSHVKALKFSQDGTFEVLNITSNKKVYSLVSLLTHYDKTGCEISYVSLKDFSAAIKKNIKK